SVDLSLIQCVITRPRISWSAPALATSLLSRRAVQHRARLKQDLIYVRLIFAPVPRLVMSAVRFSQPLVVTSQRQHIHAAATRQSQLRSHPAIAVQSVLPYLLVQHAPLQPVFARTMDLTVVRRLLRTAAFRTTHFTSARTELSHWRQWIVLQEFAPPMSSRVQLSLGPPPTTSALTNAHAKRRMCR
ncbi:hypothetical protein BGX24_007199, partial [Mortierella sp. AD032]